MHVDDAILAPVRELYGPPVVLSWDGEISDVEWSIATHNPVRTHDVTLFILDPGAQAWGSDHGPGQSPQKGLIGGYAPGAQAWGSDHGPGQSSRKGLIGGYAPGQRIALIRKPHFAAGVWRPPGGGIKPGEDFAAGAVREALEETGLHVELRRYLVASEVVFRNAGRELPWQTHVLLAETEDAELAPNDPGEIADARWGTLEELAGPLRERLLAEGRELWRYRVALHDAALAQLLP